VRETVAVCVRVATRVDVGVALRVPVRDGVEVRGNAVTDCVRVGVRRRVGVVVRVVGVCVRVRVAVFALGGVAVGVAVAPLPPTSTEMLARLESVEPSRAAKVKTSPPENPASG
jgi:hypothetical protein